MKYNGKKYSGQNINKIMYQETQEQIEVNIRYRVQNLPFIFINNMQYLLVLEVIGIINDVINNQVNQVIKEQIKTNVEYAISNLRFVIIGDKRYYSAFAVCKILDNIINDLERKIFF